MPNARLRLGVGAAGFATFVNLYATQSILPILAADFATSLAQVGLTITIPLLAIATMAPFVGGISDAYGRRALIVGAAALLVLPTLAAAFAPTLPLLLLCRFLQGLLLPFIFAVTVAYIAEELPGRPGVPITGAYVVGTIFGGFLGRFIAGWTTQLLQWRDAFLVLAALTAIMAATAALCIPRETRFDPIRNWRSSLAGFADQFRNAQVVATCALGFAVLFTIIATFTYANFLLAAPPYRLGPAGLGSIFVVYLFGAVATPVAGRLILRLGRRRTLLCGAAIAAAGLLLTLLPSLPAIVLGMALVATGVFTEQTISIGYVGLAARRARSTAVGLYVTIYYVGGAIGGIAPAGIWAHLGWPGCVALILAVQAAAMTLTWLVWPRQEGLP